MRVLWVRGSDVAAVSARPGVRSRTSGAAGRAGAALLALGVAADPGVAPAQIVLDGTLGPGGPITPAGGEYTIPETVGRTEGTNLFHSFAAFSVPAREIATFTGSPGLERVIGRVTGGVGSSIDGVLRSTIPGADLYLINPAGIVFGPNARVEVGGAFHASTASYLRLADGVRFDAIAPGAGAPLTSAPPVAFGFLDRAPAGLSVTDGALHVEPGRSLSLVAGPIEVAASAAADAPPLLAPSGRVLIASVGSPGEVGVEADGPRLVGFETLGDLALKGEADSGTVLVSTAGDPGGSIYIRAGRLTLDRAGMTAGTLGEADHPGTGIDVEVTGEVVVGPQSEMVSSSFAGGRGGDIRLRAGTLELVGDPRASSPESPQVFFTNIGARAFGREPDAGDAGAIAITADRLTLRNNAFISAETLGPGDGGDISVVADVLEVLGQDGLTYLGTYSQGAGDAGDLHVDAQGVVLRGGGWFTGLTTQVAPGGQGRAGDLRVRANRLEILGGAQISSSVFDGGADAGDIALGAEHILIAGFEPLDGAPSGVFATSRRLATGHGGDIRIQGGELRVSDTATISARSLTSGDGGSIDIRTRGVYLSSGGSLQTSSGGFGLAGDIVVNADTVRLEGPSPAFRPTAISSEAGARAAGSGAVHVVAGTVELLAGASISTLTFGPPAGAIDIRSGSLLLAGTGNGQASRLDARTVTSGVCPACSTGRGGDVRVRAGRVTVRDGAAITAATDSAGDGGRIDLQAHRLEIGPDASISTASTGTGRAGDIAIRLGDSLEGRGGRIATEALTADGGNIVITAPRLVDLQDSQVTTSVRGGTGSGGNIFIDPDLVVLRNTQVQANAFGGPGGNIRLVAGQLVADPASVIEASSALSIDGTVEIDAPDTDVSGRLAVLPSSYVDAAGELSRDCVAARAGRSSLVQAAGGGLPPEPDGYLPSLDLPRPEPRRAGTGAALPAAWGGQLACRR